MSPPGEAEQQCSMGAGSPRRTRLGRPDEGTRSLVDAYGGMDRMTVAGPTVCSHYGVTVISLGSSTNPCFKSHYRSAPSARA